MRPMIRFWCCSSWLLWCWSHQSPCRRPWSCYSSCPSPTPFRISVSTCPHLTNSSWTLSTPHEYLPMGYIIISPCCFSTARSWTCSFWYKRYKKKGLQLETRLHAWIRENSGALDDLLRRDRLCRHWPNTHEGPPHRGDQSVCILWTWRRHIAINFFFFYGAFRALRVLGRRRLAGAFSQAWYFYIYN